MGNQRLGQRSSKEADWAYVKLGALEHQRQAGAQGVPTRAAGGAGLVHADWSSLGRSPALFITTPAFAASVEVPIVVDPRRPLDPRRPVCNRPRGLPCTTPINPPPKKCKYYEKCPSGPPATNINENN
ncbi:hypothetical protein J5N97_001048 [Dioscorea zingiberensis]|uniref:Uncharacterized protein n=1 Tax=Dioscorea zingiberensis TaxID=325984 RepID=A0A9D5BUQ9_9LILI|nr:hypothetical protein J5N97_001048 [Dioscorea zingiberensis]